MTYVGDWQWLPGALTEAQASQVQVPVARTVEQVRYLIAVASRHRAGAVDLDVFEVLSEEPEPVTRSWFSDVLFDLPRWGDIPAAAERRLSAADYRLADGAQWRDEGDRWVVPVAARRR